MRARPPAAAVARWGCGARGSGRRVPGWARGASQGEGQPGREGGTRRQRRSQ
jgi:hypothetical protein